jgi:hypothetical protein
MPPVELVVWTKQLDHGHPTAPIVGAAREVKFTGFVPRENETEIRARTEKAGTVEVHLVVERAWECRAPLRVGMDNCHAVPVAVGGSLGPAKVCAAGDKQRAGAVHLARFGREHSNDARGEAPLRSPGSTHH